MHPKPFCLVPLDLTGLLCFPTVAAKKLTDGHVHDLAQVGWFSESKLPVDTQATCVELFVRTLIKRIRVFCVACDIACLNQDEAAC